MNVEQEIQYFDETLQCMLKTFVKKRNDYGPSTTETFKKFGPVSMLVRMHDKLARLDRILGGNVVTRVDESVNDTLLDLANYCIITMLELAKVEAEQVKPCPGYNM